MFVEGQLNSGIILSWTTDNTSDCDSLDNYESTFMHFHLDCSYH